MEMAKSIGNVSKICSCSFDWEITDFLSLSTKTKDFYSSHTFESHDELWNLRIYPNGSSDKSHGWVSLYLNKQNCGQSPLLLNFEISIKDSTGAKHTSRSLKQEFKKDECAGVARYYLRNKLIEEMDLTAAGSKLVISCLFLCEKPAEDDSSNPTVNDKNPTEQTKDPQEPLIVNFKDLFLNKFNSDTLIRVKAQDFPAHKRILASKSSVFKRQVMQNDVIVIEGFNSDVVKNMLSYIYCGEVKSMTVDNIFDLYAISSKYHIEDLKEECEKFLMKEEEKNVFVLCLFFCFLFLTLFLAFYFSS